MSGFILIVAPPDSAPMQQVREQLEARGLQVEQCPDARSTVKLFRQGGVRLALLWGELPSGPSGYVLCSRLKANPRVRDIPVLIAGDATRNAQHRQHKTHADGYVDEPVEVPELVALVERLMREPSASSRAATKPALGVTENERLSRKLRRQDKLEGSRWMVGCGGLVLTGGLVFVVMMARAPGTGLGDVLGALGFCVLLPASLGLFFWYMLWREEHEYDIWGDFRMERGLRAWRRQGCRGTWEGRELELFTEDRGTRRSSHYVAVLRLDVRDALPPELKLTRERLEQKLMMLVGRGDEQVGSPSFDSAFTVTGLSAHAKEVLRDEGVQRALLTLVGSVFQTVLVEAGWLHVERWPVPHTRHELEAMVESVYRVARELSRAAREARVE